MLEDDINEFLDKLLESDSGLWGINKDRINTFLEGREPIYFKGPIHKKLLDKHRTIRENYKECKETGEACNYVRSNLYPFIKELGFKNLIKTCDSFGHPEHIENQIEGVIRVEYNNKTTNFEIHEEYTKTFITYN